ncbi:MAG: pyridoxamine kinase [Oscillospiraceae bacterium]|nr:pyridoxamine kinase [Oscillospiraceae bacterium]
MKRVLTVQDFSCFGKCSLTIALPVISALGVECVAIPSTILSTHTGNLGDVTAINLEKHIDSIILHFRKLNLTFDVIYIGYLGSVELVEIAYRLITSLRSESTIVLVDPVMGEYGKLYSRLNNEYVQQIKTIVKLADYIVPNMTEATLLTNHPYLGEQVSREHLAHLFKLLADTYDAYPIITGIIDSGDMIGIATVDKEQDFVHLRITKRLPSHYHGTGDLFASLIAGTLANGLEILDVLDDCVEFITRVILATTVAGTDERYGLQFEGLLGVLSDW